MENDLSQVKPYGDTLGDGAIQLSFTLPIPYGEEAREACIQLAKKMGLEEIQIYHMKDLGINYTFFIIYGKLIHSIDFTTIRVPKLETKRMDFYQINEKIKNEFKRKITIIGACTGTDAHTVGIDAIMNMKGFNGEYGLERYPMIDAYNLGSQVKNEDLVQKIIELKADAVLVSQVVTQKGVHLKNLTELVELLEGAGIRKKIILICGGPRINHETALELGYDAGFGAGTVATDVASFIIEGMIKRSMK
ncbi:cobalamin B12-binding domain-containing protein [Anaerobacillus sp. CMMVII]|uniref:lysine 5,6-aminomutase subunit beta n=1 Tax=Anaerobacillus sp. CMMVII TaxID=2755588 RepID=UPI0021B76982|nr:OAM dimerization domain-containing protein [Anaerobacillus sp. CMMVII]MCT8138063.1 cobalamin B12-binding domain-containing protein [Anaerobacillus sp. CMMVII]